MSITLIIPAAGIFQGNRAERLRYPAMETLLARSHVQQAMDEHTVIAELFGLPPAFGVAPFMRLADTGKHGASFYFRADPVHLAPDRDQLVMLPLSVLQVRPEEARALAEAFNRTYIDEGYLLETPYPERWYLRMPESFMCVTHAPLEVAGGSVFEYMPRGADGQRLRQLMNEVQMLFHDQPINQAREAAGTPAINSLWIWGGGRLPESQIAGPDSVLTDVPLVAGLARFAGSNCSAWSGTLQLPSKSENRLIAVDCTSDSAFALLEVQLAEPLLHAVRTHQVDALLIYPGNRYCYRVTRASLRRFWRRPQALIDMLHPA
jgi:hypothetical protein